MPPGGAEGGDSLSNCNEVTRSRIQHTAQTTKAGAVGSGNQVAINFQNLAISSSGLLPISIMRHTVAVESGNEAALGRLQVATDASSGASNSRLIAQDVAVLLPAPITLPGSAPLRLLSAWLRIGVPRQDDRRG